jgi:Ribosomal protein L9
MQIILLETLNKLGKAGEVVSVKDGFAKIFLFLKKKQL